MDTSARLSWSLLLACSTVACLAEPTSPNPGFTPTGPGGLPDGPLTVCDLAKAIFLPKCAGCHAANGQAPDLSLEGARVLVGAPSITGGVQVVAGDRGRSELYRKVAGTHAQGVQMPPGAPLSSAQIEGVGRWIDGGANVECTLDGPIPTPERHHPAGWAEPAQHGLELKLRTHEADCRNCHGAELTGGVGPSCDGCHQEGWRRNCTYCHGGTDDDSGAPPTDLSGQDTGLTFTAHSAHRAVTRHPRYDCFECHQKPTEVTSPGHVFDATPGQPEVDFGRGLATGGMYLGDGRCSNLYCHGAGIGGPGTADQRSPPTCGSCHPVQSSPPGSFSQMSGAHAVHLIEGTTCDQCHSNTVAGEQLLDPEAHANGAADIRIADGLTVTYSDRGCTGVCHGEAHDLVNWFAE